MIDSIVIDAIPKALVGSALKMCKKCVGIISPFKPNVPFVYPPKFQRGMKMEHWAKMG